MSTDPDDPDDPDEPAEHRDPPGTDPRLEVEYPAAWRYRVIGADEASLRRAIAEVAGADEHEVREGNTSRTGRYVSLELVVTVTDDEHRRRLFARLADHAAVRFVL